jgi:hypothetical protein
LGLATSPALFAWEEHPEMGILIQRKFKEPGDVEKVYFLSLSFSLQRPISDAYIHTFLRPGILFYGPPVYNAHTH